MLPFTKYHGIGNDFLVIDAPAPFPPETARSLCDRHFGVGADGILLLSPHPNADARMIIQNADGSQPEMCGNGLRCAAFHLARTTVRAPATVALRIQTDAGPKTCQVAPQPDGATATVTIDLGYSTVPTAHTVSLDGHSVTLFTTSIGNPHAVLFHPQLDFASTAPRLATHTDFPNGVNVSFVVVEPGPSFSVRVWERGVGPTLACGTAAAAVAAVAVYNHLAAAGHPLTITLPGGQLSVTLDTHGQALLTGPAEHVFDGHLPRL